MQTWMQLAVLIGVLAVVGVGVVVVVLARNARTAQGPAMAGKYPQGHWMSVGMGIGIALGCIPSLVGLLFEEMAPFVGIGPAMGLGFGVAIGLALERKHKDELRPLTEEEQKMRRRATGIGMLLMLFGVLALGIVIVLLLSR